MKSSLLASVACASLILGTACATQSGTGAAVGATGGGIAGAALGGGPGLLVGAAVGGMLGYTAGRVMEEEDRRQVAYALEADRAQRWTNPHTGSSYYVQPTGTVNDSGWPCRQFRLVTDQSGKDQKDVYGTACQRPDGTWELEAT